MNYFKEILQERLGEAIKSINSITGGDINDVYKIITNQNTYVLKVNRKDLFPKMFKKEKQGLEMLMGAGVKSPEVILTFSDSEYQYLLLEFIKEENISTVFWENFAKSLANLHKKQNNFFGLEYNNYIGSLQQINTPKDTWEIFFIENRIKPLVKIAFDKNRLDRNHLNHFENLYNRLDEILPKENPSLVHGDLWSGNLMCGKDQTPVFIDPAIYFGNREMDIAMTQIFGGFDNSYLTFYNEIYPLEKEWEERINIYNLYPRLVHLILFGRSYLGGIESVLKKF